MYYSYPTIFYQHVACNGMLNQIFLNQRQSAVIVPLGAFHISSCNKLTMDWLMLNPFLYCIIQIYLLFTIGKMNANVAIVV
jgi:hypothetical protein